MHFWLLNTNLGVKCLSRQDFEKCAVKVGKNRNFGIFLMINNSKLDNAANFRKV